MKESLQIWQKPIFKKSVVEQKTAATRDNQNIRYNTKTRYVNNKILSDSSLPVLFGGQTYGVLMLSGIALVSRTQQCMKLNVASSQNQCFNLLQDK